MIGFRHGREPGSRWKEWVNWVALTGGVLLGGLVADVITGAFLAGTSFVVSLAVWAAIVLACGFAALFITGLRLRRLDAGC